MAGTIGQLNFEVIISDKKFDAQIKEVEAKARQFNTSLSNILNIRKISTQMSQKDVENARRVWQAKVDEQRAQEKINREKVKTEGLQRKINAQIDRATKGYNQQSRILNELKGYALGYLSIHGAGQLLSSLVRVTGEFELQKTTLAAMLGDLNKAEDVITRIQGLAVESPFQFKELTTYAKQLSAFSVPAQELYDTTKMLADVSAGLGVGMDRIVLAYGQVRSAAFLRGQEVRQFTEAGIPILNELAKQFSELEGRAVSTSEVFDKISKRLVPFEMVAQVFKDMTSEGGKFYNMQEVQAETLRGKISNLKDAYEVMLNEIGKGQSENLKGAVDWLRKLMQNYEEVGQEVMRCVVAFGILKTATELLSVAMGNLAFKNVGFVKSLRNVAAFAAKNPYTLIAAGLTAAGYGLYKWISHVEEFEKVWGSVVETSEEYYKSLAIENSKLDTLYAKLNLAKEGTEEYAEARKQIFSQYAQYISQLKDEGIEVNNLADIYDNLKGKIEESQKARFRDIASQDIEQTYGEATNKLLKKAERKINGLSKDLGIAFSELEKQALLGYVTGSLSEEEIENNEALNRIESRISFLDKIKEDFKDASNAYVDGLAAIENLYGKAEDITGDAPTFQYNLEEETKGKSPAQKAIEEQIRSVQKLQDAYEKLIPYLDEAQMKSTLKAVFPNISESVIDSLDFSAELEKLADRLEKFDEDAAQRLRDTIGKDVAGSIADSFKAVEQYKKMMDSWLGEDFNLEGEGVAFDISKIIRDLNNEYANIDNRRKKALDLLNKAQTGDEVALAKVRETLGEEVWQKYLINGTRVIDELANKEKQSAKDVSDEKIRDKANSYMKELLDARNIDLSDLSDKSTSQLSTLIERMKDLQAELSKAMGDLAVEMFNGDLDDGQKAQWDMLSKVIDMLGLKIEDVGVELKESLFDNAVEGIGIISTLSDQVVTLGEAMDSPGIAKFGESLSKTANFITDLLPKVRELNEMLKAEDAISEDGKMEKFSELSDSAKAGIVGIVAGIASFAISEVVDVIASAREQTVLLNEATLQYNETLLEVRRNAYSGIFGADEMALAAENAKILAEAQQKYADSLSAFQDDKKIRRNKYSQDSISFKKQSVSDVLGDIADLQGWDLYRENGELNMDALMSYYDAYSEHLTNKQRDVVDALIASYDAQNDAAAQQAEYLTSLFSGVADNIADSMIDAFLESGDAAIDMGNVISDVSRQMVSYLIKTLYLMPILNKYKEDIAKVEANTALTPTEATEQKLNLLDSALQEIAGQSDAITETIERFEDYLETPEQGSTALGEGIKGITEDQANLLASYLNAIRADVSYSKTLWQKMDVNLQRIADMLTSSPTLMEYQAQIAANTYNTAVATQEILAELRSVVTTDSGDSAIRVFS